MRKFVMAVLVLLIPASAFAEEKFIRTFKNTAGDTVALETAIVRYEKTINNYPVIVDVHGAVHLADKAYYIRKNIEFESYDTVLYELVANEAGQRPNKNGQDMYAMFSNFIELESQLGVIDYQAKNFVHADLTKKELTKKMRANGDDMTTLFLEFLLNAIRQQNKTAFALEDAQDAPQVSLDKVLISFQEFAENNNDFVKKSQYKDLFLYLRNLFKTDAGRILGKDILKIVSDNPTTQEATPVALANRRRVSELIVKLIFKSVDQRKFSEWNKIIDGQLLFGVRGKGFVEAFSITYASDKLLSELEILSHVRGKIKKQVIPQPQMNLMQLLIDPNRAVKIKRMMSDAMAETDVDTSFGTVIGGYLIVERNKKCIAGLEIEFEVLLAHPRYINGLGFPGPKFAIFYGTAHMPDLEKRILALGFKRTKIKWTQAWDLFYEDADYKDPLLELLRQLQKLE